MSRRWYPIAFLALLGTLPFAAPAVCAAVSPVSAQEMLFGNGTPGPFSLSWTEVRFGSERLSVNGTRLYLGLDYQIDYSAGAITFSQPLQSNQIAQVEYVYDAAQAKANHAPAQVPLALRLWGGDSSGLQMIGAVQPGVIRPPSGGHPAGTPTASLLGFRGETALGGGQLSSLFLMAPASGTSPGASAWQTAALRFGASHDKGPFKFSGSFGQAGSSFSQAKDYQLQQGLRTLDLSAAFDPSKRFSLTSQVKRQEALDPSGKAQSQSSIASQLTLAPASGTKLTLSQQSSTQAQAQGPAQTLDLLRAQLEQKLGGSTTATAIAEQQRAGSSGTTLTTGLNLVNHLSDRTQLTAGFTHRDSAKDGRLDTLSLGVNAGRGQHVALQGGYVRALGEKNGLDTTSNLQLSVRPAAQLGFHIGFNQHVTDRQGDQTGTDWGVTVGKQAALKVEGQSTEKLAAAGPMEQQDQLRIEATPLRGVKVAQLNQTDQVGQDPARQAQETSLELSPLKALKIAGALRDQEQADGTAHIRSISGSVKPAAFLDLSGAYKTHEAPAGDTVVTRNVQLALTPIHGFKVRGGYSENPEDKDGNVQPTTDRSVGVDTAIGSFSLGGSYTLGEGTAGPLQKEQTELRLALNFWGHSRLYSSYKESAERAGSLTEDRTLSLGFSRSLTENFYLLLEGQVTQVAVDGVPQPGMGDQRAQAKLGLRF